MFTLTAIVVTLMLTGLMAAGVVVGIGTAVGAAVGPDCDAAARVAGFVLGCGIAVAGVGSWYTFVFKVIPLMGV